MLPPIICFRPPSNPWAMLGERTMMPRTMPTYFVITAPTTSFPVVTIIRFSSLAGAMRSLMLTCRAPPSSRAARPVLAAVARVPGRVRPRSLEFFPVEALGQAEESLADPQHHALGDEAAVA